MTSKHLAVTTHSRTLLSGLHRFLLVAIIALATACTSTPTADRAPSDRQDVNAPATGNNTLLIPKTDDTTLDVRVISWNQKLAQQRGWLFALTELETADLGYISTNTGTFIRSQLLWLKGDIEQSAQLLNDVETTTPTDRDRLLAERQRRFTETHRYIAAAKIALERVMLGVKTDDPTTHSTVFNLLSKASEQRLASELRRTEPNSDWHQWLSLNRAYRRGREDVFSWLAEHPILPSGALDLPSGLRDWLNSDPPRRIAVLLPLSNRLKSAGQTALEGIVEGLYATFRDPALRPDIITIDTEAAGSARAAYLRALESGADFVIGPLTKDRVSELQSIDNLPIPILALNRGIPDRNSATTQTGAAQVVSLSLSPEDEAEQLAQLAWADNLRNPLVIAPDTAWGARMHTAFADTWRTFGGTIREVALTGSEKTDNETIAQGLATLSSESRIKEVERAFDAPIESQSRRREDVDVVILLSPTPQSARELRPLLRFHYAGGLPVFAPASIFEANKGIANRDLDGIKFVLPPSTLSPATSATEMLHALGADAAAFVDRFNQADSANGIILFGQSGDLSTDSQGNVHRRLKPVVFNRGRARPI